MYDIKRAGATTALNAYDYNSRVLPVLSYVAQLAPLPRNFAFEQRVAFHIIYHAPFNTFAHSDFFQWGEMGLPKLRCAIATSAAALMRTANRTISCWQEWFPQIRQAAETLLPVQRVFGTCPLFYPVGWDAPSYTENLWHASKGSCGNPTIDEAGKQIIQKHVGVDLAQVRQRKYYHHILEYLYQPGNCNQLDICLMRRIINLFAPHDVNFSNHINLHDCMSVLKELSESDRLKVIKTWLNGWATSRRIKGDFLYNCILGCEESPDCLSHYLQCSRVYGACIYLWPDTPDDPLIRCGLCAPTKDRLTKVACVFSAYHATKHKFIQGFVARGHTQIQTDEYWITFAQSLSTEAVARALSCTLFDPCQFFNHFQT